MAPTCSEFYGGHLDSGRTFLLSSSRPQPPEWIYWSLSSPEATIPSSGGRLRFNGPSSTTTRQSAGLPFSGRLPSPGYPLFEGISLVDSASYEEPTLYGGSTIVPNTLYDEPPGGNPQISGSLRFPNLPSLGCPTFLGISHSEGRHLQPLHSTANRRMHYIRIRKAHCPSKPPPPSTGGQCPEDHRPERFAVGHCLYKGPAWKWASKHRITKITNHGTASFEKR